MKKQKIQIGIFLVVLVVCIFGYLAAKQLPKEEETAVSSESQTVSNIDKEDVAGLSYLYEGEIIELVKNGETWQAKNDTSLQMDQEQIETMLGYVCNVTTDTVIDEPEELANYGLSNPANTICLTLGDESVIQLLIGDCMDITGEYYALLAGDPKVYTISSYIVTNFEKSLEELVVEEGVSETTTVEESEATASEE